MSTSQEISEIETSNLPASGFTKTRSELHAWAKAVVDEARSIFGNDVAVDVGVWAYREQGREFLSADLHIKKQREPVFPITICAEGECYFPEITGGAAEADVPDMVEAMHLVGIITRALGATVSIGRGENEVNTDVLAAPLGESHTNGPIDLWPTNTN